MRGVNIIGGRPDIRYYWVFDNFRLILGDRIMFLCPDGLQMANTCLDFSHFSTPSVSSVLRCEVRPGPEFLTRSYTFHPSRHFQALQHYYADSGCEEPAYSLSIRGKLRLRHASWITRGATEADHHLSRVAIVVHSQAAKQRLAARLPSSCVGLTLDRVAVGRPLELYNSRAGRACLSAMGFTMAELGLMRVETQHQHGHHGGKVQELLLGDIHTEWTQRTQYRPTGYQEPLQNAMVSFTVAISSHNPRIWLQNESTYLPV